MKRKRPVILLTAGVLCLAAAMALAAYNIWDEGRAARSVQVGTAGLMEAIPEKPEAEQIMLPEPQAMMTTITMDGRDYIGILELPALGKVLPIQGTWSETQLKHSPCLYQGNLYDGMIIAGHNYRSHFTGLPQLRQGDEVRFTDVDGNVWRYTVAAVQIIDGSDVEGMEAGDWDLTLFTCTYGGGERYTVRCMMEIL